MFHFLYSEAVDKKRSWYFAYTDNYVPQALLELKPL